MKRIIIAGLLLATAACTGIQSPTQPERASVRTSDALTASYEDRTGRSHEGYKGQPTLDCTKTHRSAGITYCKGTGKWVGWFAKP